MARQKSGLHKEVGVIFDGIPNPNEIGNDNAEQSFDRQQDYSSPDKSEAGEPIQTHMHSQTQTLPQTKPSKPAESSPFSHSSQPVEQPARRGIMLPASLTIGSSGMGLINKAKIKIAELVEKNGKRQLFTLIAIPVLAIVLIFVMWNSLFSSPARKSPVKAAAQVGLNSAVPAKKLQIVWPNIEPYPETLRDPMMVSTARRNGGTANPGNLTVNGILYDANQPAISKAIINGQQVKIGDSISGISIVNISTSQVEFEAGGKKWKQSVGY